MARAGIDVHADLADVALDWEDLADRVDAPPWLRPAWFTAWREAFGAGVGEIVALRRDGRLAGVVALESSGGVLRSLANYHTPAFGLLGEDAAALTELADAVMARSARRVDLRFLPDGESSLVASVAAARRHRRQAIVRTLERSPVVDTTGSWDDYASGRRGHLLRELRRRRRRLGETGRLELVVEEDRRLPLDRLDGLLAEGFAVEASGWKGERATAIASRPQTRAFYTSVARWASGCGWLRLAFLRLDGRATAFDFALEHGGVHALLKTGFDPAFRRFAPGMLLRHEMLRRAFHGPIRRYEFLGHDDPWKLEWADETANQVHLQAFRRSPRGLAEWAAFRWGRPVAARLVRRGRRR